MRQVCITALFTIISLCSFAQQKQVVKLEKYYNKGQYETCNDRARYFLKKYSEEPEIHLYVALSAMKIVRNGNAKSAETKALMNDVLAYTRSAHKHSNGQVFQLHKKDAELLHTFIKTYADNLYKKNPADSKEAYELLAVVFNDSTENYKQLLKPGTVATTPTPAPVTETKPNTKPNKPKPAGNPPKYAPTSPEPELTADKLIAFAESFMGTPYKSAGCGPEGFDCSGFVHYVYKHFGIELPRSSSGLAVLGDKVPMKSIKTGDLVFYGATKGGKTSIQHVAIVHSVGEGSYYSIIHSSSRGVVIDDPMSSSWDYWQQRFLFVRRPNELPGT